MAFGGQRRRSNRLSAQRVKHANSPGLHADGWGLYLLVGRTGSKSWIYRYRQNRRLRSMGLGPLRLVSLGEAREAAQVWRKLRYQGGDPIAARRAEKDQRRLEAAKAISFRQCAEAYIAAHRAGWKNAKHAAQWPNTLGTYVYPIFGELPVQAIDVALVMKVLEQPAAVGLEPTDLIRGASDHDKRLWWHKTETASRVRQRIEAILDWAHTRGYRTGENPARWDGHLENLLPKKTKVRAVAHHAALPYDKLPAFMAELRNEKGVAARALEFTILTIGRTGAVIGAVSDEIKNQVWTVPAARMKGDKQHAQDFRVPLSAPALALVEQMGTERETGFLFPGGKRGKPLSNMAMLKLLERSGRGDLTVHGFKSTFKDWAHEQTNFPREVIEMAMAHAIDSKVEAAYRRGELFEKRRQLMEAWGRYCSAPPATGEVVTLQRNIRQ
jgi:integrase